MTNLHSEVHLTGQAVEEDIPIPKSEGWKGFASELEALGGNFVPCSPNEVTDKILEILHSRGMSELMVWDQFHLPASIIERLSKAGIQVSLPTSETLASCSLIRAGLTGAIAGIADTGSILLLGGPGRPMTASLLPEVHIAILWEKDIVENLGEVLQREDVTNAPAAVLVTGPSRTADIEMALTIGVHGPGELYILCITGE